MVPTVRQGVPANPQARWELGYRHRRGLEPWRTDPSLYQYELLIDLVRNQGFKLCKEFFWYNRARLPSPAEWVNVRRVRVKGAVDPIWWLSLSPNPRANNRKVLQEYSEAMRNLLVNGYKAKLRPSGWDISPKFSHDLGGSIPSNLLDIPNTDSNSWYLRACKKAGLKPHPARFPLKLPEFFIRFLTNQGELVLDPFGGSNATGYVAEVLGRRWLCFEIRGDYLKSSGSGSCPKTGPRKPRRGPRPWISSSRGPNYIAPAAGKGEER